MLDREVCKTCVNKAGFAEWGEEIGDDENWENGFVECPDGFGYSAKARVDQKPPPWCQYGLEHLVCKRQSTST